jgi:hypothetical protein
VLLTRSPLSPSPKAWFSLDLHVLSAPPAFVLSQDQTLREEWLPTPRVENNPEPAILSLRAFLLLKGLFRRTDEVLIPAPTEVGPGLDTRRTFAVEFSKTGAVSL